MAHSSMSAQAAPSPAYPALQAQEKEPGTFRQVAFGSQPAVRASHSSMSLQASPSPE